MKDRWRFDEREHAYIKEVLDSGFVSGTSGTMNSRLERGFADKMGRRFGITFNSGTTTLHASLEALGVGYGDEVIVPALTVISCMNAVVYCHAVPVFADVDPDTFLMDPQDVRRKVTDRTKAIMPVHLYGQVCDMTAIMEVADEFDLKVLEDSAQCFLGEHGGRLAGTMGHVASWSFENSKHLTTGDGGIVLLDDEDLGDRIRKLSTQGYRNATAVSGKVRVDKDLFQNPNYKRHDSFGYMYRLPEVAAAVGLAQLEKLDWFVARREQMAALYASAIESAGSEELLVPQRASASDRHSYWTFAARLSGTDVGWPEFRRRHIENGGDGVYAAWTLSYLEDSIPDVQARLDRIGLAGRMSVDLGICPNAERIQPQLMQFTTNQGTDVEMEQQADALYRTVKSFA